MNKPDQTPATEPTDSALDDFKDLTAQVLKDPQFWLAMALGPIVWLVLWFFTGKPGIHGLAPTVLLMSVILYPLVEEFAFRGFIQTWMLEKPIGKKLLFLKLSGANFLTSFLFAASHLFSQPPLWAALVFFPSLVFGYFRERYDAVVPSVIIHSWYNLGFLCLVA